MKAAALRVAMAVLATGIPAAVGWSAHTPNDRVVKVLQAFEFMRSTPVWPGYTITRPILLHIDGNKTFLLGAGAAPAGFRRAQYGSATVFERSGPLAGLDSDFVYHFDLKGQSVFALRVSAGMGVATEIEV